MISLQLQLQALCIFISLGAQLCPLYVSYSKLPQSELKLVTATRLKPLG